MENSHAFLKILTDNELSRQIQLAVEAAFNEGIMLKGRQCLFIVYEHKKMCEGVDAYYYMHDLKNIALKNDDLSRFVDKWNHALMGMKPEHVPNDTMKLFFINSFKHPGRSAMTWSRSNEWIWTTLITHING